MVPTTLTDAVILAVWMCWLVLATTPSALQNRDFAAIFPNPRTLKRVLASCGLEFAPGLLAVLGSPTTPTISFFKTLPLYLVAIWAVYLLVLKKRGCRPRIYVGSGTCSVIGVKKRLTQHDKRQEVPRYVQQAYEEGYKLTSTGLLCWAPMPPVLVRVPLRAGFLLLEAVFALKLWAMKSRTKHYFMPRICLWPIATLEYDDCCGHFSVNENIPAAAEYKRENLTPEQIEEIELYYAQKLQEQGRSSMERARANNLASKKYFCDPCSLPCCHKTEFAKHKRTQKHKDKVDGVTRVVKNERQAKFRTKNLAERKYFCKLCDRGYNSPEHLTRHLTSKKHLKKVTKPTTSKLTT